MTKQISNPNKLFDTIRNEQRLKTDAALAKFLDRNAAAISNMRARRLQIGPATIIRIMEYCDNMPLARIKRLLSDVE